MNRRVSMGEQSHPLIAGNILSPIMRSSRGKFFISLAVLGTMCFILFLLSNTHSNLKQLEAVNEKCQQQRDSLSAQLQVVYEHKNRLEKSLQQEKSDHKHTKEEFESVRSKKDMEFKMQSEKETILNKQISSLKSDMSELETEKKHMENTLKEQVDNLQTQKDDELKKLQNQINELLTEKDKVEQAKSNLSWELEQRQGEINLCRLQHQQLSEKLNACNKQIGQELKVATEKPHQLQQGNKAATTVASGKLFPDAAPPLPIDRNEQILKKPSQLDEKDKNIEQINNKVDEASNLLSSNISSFQQLPKPALLKDSIAINKQPNENFEENEIKDSPRNFLKAPFGDNNLPQENHAVEKGEIPNNLPQGQLEGPDFNPNLHNEEQDFAGSNLHKVALPPPLPNVNEQGANDLAQVHDMLGKSPGDTNNIQDMPGNVPPVQDFQAALNKLNVDSPLIKPRAELPDEKQYADEDDDDQDGGDNGEDEMGGAQIRPQGGKNGFHENDFDDQDVPNDNAPAGKHVEGVIVNPK